MLGNQNKMAHTLADRLGARCRQLGLSVAHVAQMAGVNRSFIYDILRGRSMSPSLENLERVAAAIRVDRDWLLHGIGEVEGESPFIANPDEEFVSIPLAQPRSMGNGAVELAECKPGRNYHFRRSWIRKSLGTSPSNLRILDVAVDSMVPTLLKGDTVLVDLARRSPAPPGIFVLHDGMGLVAKRLEHVPNSDPPRVRIISDIHAGTSSHRSDAWPERLQRKTAAPFLSITS